MCSRANCRRCGKVTWRGCGQHVDSVMAGVAAKDRCKCEPEPRRSLLSSLFGRG